jgi:hypothetical protein
VASIATVTTPVTGTPISSTTFGDPVAANLALLMRQGTNIAPYFSGYLAGTQALSAGVSTAIALDTEIKDSDNMHVTTGGSNMYLTDVTAGLLLVIAQISFPAVSSGHLSCFVQQNGTTIASLDVPALNVGAQHVQCSTIVEASVNDVIEMFGSSVASVSALNAGAGATWMKALWLGLNP